MTTSPAPAPVIHLVTVPYDSGHRAVRHGAGPGALVDAGAIARLAGAGANVQQIPLESELDPPLENASGFELMRLVAQRSSAAVEDGAFPVVLAGNCGTSVGVVSGIAAATGRRVGIVWLDAHGDLNTPDSTTSGFLDGMGLAVLLGRCWSGLAATVPGFRPLPDAAALLVGAHALDAAERDLLETTSIGWVPPSAISTGSTALTEALSRLAGHVDEVHLHIDLDVHDRRVAPANSYAVGGGLDVAQVREVVAVTSRTVPVCSATIASWDPGLDVGHRLRDAALDLLSQVGEIAASRAGRDPSAAPA